MHQHPSFNLKKQKRDKKKIEDIILYIVKDRCCLNAYKNDVLKAQKKSIRDGVCVWSSKIQIRYQKFKSDINKKNTHCYPQRDTTHCTYCKNVFDCIFPYTDFM